MNEMAVTADHLIVIGRGKLIADSATQDVIARSSGESVRVRTPDADRLAALITAEGGSVTPVAEGTDAGALLVTGLPAARIGELAASASVVLHELSPQLATLEEAFMELTAGSLEFGQHGPATPAAAGSAAMPGRL
jgi:ABC-2 type transport system ATP-binding protein